MAIPADRLRDAVQRLHANITKNHWNGQAIIGPDSGVRWNFRIGRFVKSYLAFLPWTDNYVFQQAQGYWILANWLMADLLNSAQCRDLALACSEFVVSAQRADGYWDYPPLPSRIGKIATVEGNIATIGLLESYSRTREETLLDAARQWYRFLTQEIGFQENDGALAVNYWADSSARLVPNNTTLTLWTLAKLAEATNDARYLASCESMMALLSRVQMESGELPYSVGHSNAPGRPHFLCFQYNAFEFLDLTQYHRITGDRTAWPILEKLAAFLSTGISETGAGQYDCHHESPEVPYYTAATAAALSQASALGLGNYRQLADRAYARLLSQQDRDGGIGFFSRRNYGLLTDRRSYPRNLAMILYHLLLELQLSKPPEKVISTAEDLVR